MQLTLANRFKTIILLLINSSNLVVTYLKVYFNWCIWCSSIFFSLCDPEKENLCLCGHPNKSWKVALPAKEVPPELLELAQGINFARNGMNRRD